MSNGWKFHARLISSLLLLLAFLPASPAAATGGIITYRKVFKSSFPEFVEIRIDESGTGTWDIHQLDEEADRQPLQVSSSLAQRVFSLAAQLHYFDKANLDVHRKIANLGEKTFRYEKGGVSHEATFNYTLSTSANQLLYIFEALAIEMEDVSALQRAMKFDRLGVNEAVQRIETDYNRKVILEPEKLLPVLDQLAADSQYLDIARQRARSLAEKIRNPK
ncbi:MAG: hypothetical protein ACRD4K_10660 [Candidatus Acidiferrales bacterium]